MHIWKLKSLHCDINVVEEMFFPYFYVKYYYFLYSFNYYRLISHVNYYFSLSPFRLCYIYFFNNFFPFLWEHFIVTNFHFSLNFPDQLTIIIHQFVFICISFTFLKIFFIAERNFFQKHDRTRTSIRSNGLNKTERKKNK